MALAGSGGDDIRDFIRQTLGKAIGSVGMREVVDKPKAVERALLLASPSPERSGQECPLHKRINENYLRAATIGAFAVSVAAGMVATLPCVGACAPFVGCACAGAAINPSALRTSVSILAKVSLLSFRNWRAFSRPWPMRSLL